LSADDGRCPSELCWALDTMRIKRGRALAVSILIAACGGKILPTSTNDEPTNGGPANDEPLVIGNACVNDTDCSHTSNDAGPTCFKTSYGEELPNGYCSEYCASASDCVGPPAAVGCGLRTPDISNDFPAYCSAVCDPQGASTQCRSGYQCLPFTTPQGTSAFGCFIVDG
jgi:hypothetical protein